MARVLHLVKGAHGDLARATIERQVAAGDTVTVAVLDGEPPALPPSVVTRRVPGDSSWAELLALIFDADHVVTW